MGKINQVNVSVRLGSDTKEYFDQTFEASGANSKGEFISMLLDQYNSSKDPVTIEKIVEKEIQVERCLDKDELLLKLSPAQTFALRETILSCTDFAQKQNEVIDSLKIGNRPFLYFGNLFEPEFQSLWVRNKVITNQMTAKEKEDAIKYNMAAFLINMFLTHIIEGKISETMVSANDLKLFIRKQLELSKKAQAPAVQPLHINSQVS